MRVYKGQTYILIEEKNGLSKLQHPTKTTETRTVETKNVQTTEEFEEMVRKRISTHVLW